MEPADPERSFGREAFGADPGGYHAARPAYPEATWEALRARAGLSAGISLLEIGAGTGLATGPLLAHGPDRLVAVEPDVRLAGFLRATIRDQRLEVITASFEAAELPRPASTSPPAPRRFTGSTRVPALGRVHAMLRRGVRSGCGGTSSATPAGRIRFTRPPGTSSPASGPACRRATGRDRRMPWMRRRGSGADAGRLRRGPAAVRRVDVTLDPGGMRRASTRPTRTSRRCRPQGVPPVGGA